MHFCFLNMAIEFYSPVSGGAISTITRHVARELIGRGHRVTVLTRVNGDPVHDVGEVVPLAFDGRAVRGRVRRAVALLHQKLQGWELTEYGAYRQAFTTALRAMPQPPDVVVAFNDFFASRYLKEVRPGVRTLVWLQNECHPRGNPAKLTGWTDRFITCSDYIRDWTMQHWHLTGDRLATILNGVDIDQFTPAPWFPRRPWRELRVLYIGRLDPSKGVDLAVEAVRRLRAEGRDVRFAFAGPVWWHGVETETDPYYCQLKAATDAIGGQYLGRLDREQVPGVLREYDVVCVLSRSEDPCPLVLSEAMACGCAVVGSRRGGIPQACGDGATLVEPDNVDQVTAALRELAKDPDALVKARRRAFARGQTLSWAEQARTVERLATLCASPGWQPSTLRACLP